MPAVRVAVSGRVEPGGPGGSPWHGGMLVLEAVALGVCLARWVNEGLLENWHGCC